MALLDDLKAHLEDTNARLQNQIDLNNQVLDKVKAELATPSVEKRMQDLIDKAGPLVDAALAAVPAVTVDVQPAAATTEAPPANG